LPSTALVELSLADEIEENPAPINTNKDADNTVLANRLAALAFMLLLLLKTESEGIRTPVL
jgi:hypothetical protein